MANFHEFFAGVVGGSTGLIVGQPFDVIRVRMQTSSKYSSTFDCMIKTWKADGFRGFYRGLVPPLSGVAALNSLLFGSYGMTKRLIEDSPDAELNLKQVFVCGSVAGFWCCFITTPTELLKCRMQVLQNESKKKSLSTLECTKGVIRARGLPGLFQGFWLTALRDVPSFGAYFVTYEYLKDLLITPRDNFDGTITYDEFVKMNVAGGLAGVVAWVVVYPVDVIKSRFQTQSLSRPDYTGVIDCLKKSVKHEGYKILFRGMNATLLRAFPLNAVTFSMYEVTMRILSGFGSSSHPASSI